jgi:ATPase family associated with various cellular activities (AAA)
MPAEPFNDNWSYLKVELNWLERLLLMAVAKQKKENKEVDRLAKTKADRASSFWWQGILNLDGKIGYDSPPPVATGKAPSYQQQLAARIQATEQQGRVLALPLLCERLGLTPFEKNLLLMGVAPEIHRRYTEVYTYLNVQEQPLLTVDLALRILCRDDRDWRAARSRLGEAGALRHHALIDLLEAETLPLLQRPLKLSDGLVSYLLAEQPDVEALLAPVVMPRVNDSASVETSTVYTQVIESSQPSGEPPPSPQFWGSKTTTANLNSPRIGGQGGEKSGNEVGTDLCVHGRVEMRRERLSPLSPFLHRSSAPAMGFDQLVLPKPLRDRALALANHQRRTQTAAQTWADWQGAGQILLLTGPAGTGKTSLAMAMAQFLEQPLVQLDLARIAPTDYSAALCEIGQQQPPVLLIQSAQHWLKRPRHGDSLTAVQVQQLLADRRQGLTILAADRLPPRPILWQTAITATLTLPMPTKPARRKLWKQVFPPELAREDWDWDILATWPLSGGTIDTVARQAAAIALGRDPVVVTLADLKQAYGEIADGLRP